MSVDTVRVALRIRPLVSSEIEKGCQPCLVSLPGLNQVQICNTEKAFSFNHVFSPETDQEEFYDTAVKSMINNLFQGYNVTILAYGQTGSGKTHSMGTNYSDEVKSSMGVIPRAVCDIFKIVESKKPEWNFQVSVSFMELYQEQLYDLLSEKQRSQTIVDIREDTKGIKISGLTEKEVTSVRETLDCLLQGSRGRATGSTAMNVQSSRSHAIFTICINQQKGNDPCSAMTAKFHLVDLAGSERSKKTQATGERFKEGVNINKGLLALGNVISALGEGNSTYVGYRDSKLTRLLQDSLGGNSVTLMIACVSPADYNLDETLSTLRYADRARKIKNKPIVNQDPKAAEINRLNKQVQELQLALMGQGTYLKCPPEHAVLSEKNHELQIKIREITQIVNANLLEIVNMHERAELAEEAREKMQEDVERIIQDCLALLKSYDEIPIDSEKQRHQLQDLYTKMLDIQNNQKQAMEKLVKHELSRPDTQALVNKENTEATKENEDANFSSNSEMNATYDVDEENREYTLRQFETMDEVQNINKELALKEDLVAQLLKVSSTFNADYTKELDMEKEIKTLQAEKEELLQALQSAQNNKASQKLSETRRKKVQELEKKIAELTKKCMELNRANRDKERSVQQVKVLSNEIQSLKQVRVKLIRQLRSESETFSKWKHSREKEMRKLKEQDRKRAYELSKMQTQHNKQQQVFKRRIEEALAANKRLKEALEKNVSAQQHRRDKMGGKEKSNNWINQELEIVLSTIDAQCSLDKLMQHRESLAQQLESLKADENQESVKTDIEEIEDSLKWHNVQITELQQKILESDQENRSHTRFQSIQSMSDAKAVLKSLLEAVSEERRQRNATEESKEMQNLEIQKLTEELKVFKKKERDAKFKQRLTFALNTPNKEDPTNSDELNNLRKELDVYKERVEELESMKENSSKRSKIARSKSLDEKPLQENLLNLLEYSTDDSFIDQDNQEADPDWKKTPLYARVRHLQNTTRQSDESRRAAKRDSDGEVKCSCKTNCTKRLCTCRKNDKVCINCNCDPIVCQNRKPQPKCELFPEPPISEDMKRARYDVSASTTNDS